jgi:inner membrane protein
MLSPTHLIFALSLAYLTRFPRIPAAIGGVIPDLDYVMDSGFPFSHRGIVHTLAFMSLSMILIYLISRRTGLTLGFGLGFLSHLFLDNLTPTGIAWLYPILPAFFSLNLAYYDNPIANLGITALSLAFLLPLTMKWRPPGGKEMLRFLATTLLILGVLLVSYIGGSISGNGNAIYAPPSQPQDYSDYTISELLEILPLDQYVSVSGKVSQVQEDYTSKKGYEYQQFLLSDGSREVKIFCSKYRGSTPIEQGDEISLRGRFQKYYSTYEIYLECSGIETRD